MFHYQSLLRPLCWLVLALLYGSFSQHLYASPREDIAPGYSQLKARAQQREKVRVIAQLPTDPQASAQVQQWAALLSMPVLKTFQRYPLVVFEVSEAQLDILIDSGLVTLVVEDQLNATQLAQSVPYMGADLSHNFSLRGAGATLAIIDTGVDNDHPEFVGRIVEEACFSTRSIVNSSISLCPNGQSKQYGPGAAAPCALCNHGTHVAGIAASAHNTAPGVAPEANIIAIQVFSEFSSESICGAGKAPCLNSYTSDMLKGLEYVEDLAASYTIAAVNMSMGGGKYTAACDTDTLKQAIDQLYDLGIATVASSGNHGYTDALMSPACITRAISVGSVSDSTGAIPSWSNSASFLDLLAPGKGITSSVPGGGRAGKSGTSMSAPHVTGALALLKANNPAATVAELEGLLKSYGQAVTDSRNGITVPRVDMTQLTADLAGPDEIPQLSIIAPVAGAVISTEAGAIILQADASDLQDGDLSAQVQWLSDLDGALSSPATLSVGSHVITASVLDSVGFAASQQVSVTIANTPSVTIIAPLGGEQFIQGATIALQGSASDIEDGDLSASIQWQSDLDGALGSGANLSPALSPGGHSLTATVLDSQGHAPFQAPQVLITVLADSDGDQIADTVDNCPAQANADQLDADADGVGDICDNDLDGDGVVNAVDNCPNNANSDQSDVNNNGIGDACDTPAGC